MQEKDDIIIEEKMGKKSGYALVFLSNAEVADQARSAVHMKKIGTRYVETMRVNPN